MEWKRQICLPACLPDVPQREREDAFIGFKRESLGSSAESARRREEMEGRLRPLEEGGNVAGIGE